MMLTISLCPEWSNAAIAISAGLLFGLITMLVQYVGLFMLGFHSGLLAGLVGLCCVELYYVPPTAWLTLGVLLATGLVFALLTLYFQVIKSIRIWPTIKLFSCRKVSQSSDPHSMAELF